MTLSQLRAAIDKALASRPDMGEMPVTVAGYPTPAGDMPAPLGDLTGIHMHYGTAVIAHRSTR